jgi:hypothetical protein
MLMDAHNLLAEYQAARKARDYKLAAKLGAQITELADDLVSRLAPIFPSFNALLDAWAAHRYRPTLRADLGADYVLLADIYDMAQGLRGRDVVAYRG